MAVHNPGPFKQIKGIKRTLGMTFLYSPKLLLIKQQHLFTHSGLLLLSVNYLKDVINSINVKTKLIYLHIFWNIKASTVKPSMLSALPKIIITNTLPLTSKTLKPPLKHTGHY